MFFRNYLKLPTQEHTPVKKTNGSSSSPYFSLEHNLFKDGHIKINALLAFPKRIPKKSPKLKVGISLSYGD